MDEIGQLDRIVRRRREAEASRAVRLGDAVGQLMERRILAVHSKFGPVSELWNQLLPGELVRHCKLAGVSGGQLKVCVDSPVYLYELRLCGPELLRELQRHCPAARIKEIKFVIG